MNQKKESLSRKLAFGTFYLLSSSIASIGINVITIGFIARKLAVEDFGLYSALLSFTGLFQFISDFGLNRTLLKFGSTDIKNTAVSFGNALLVKSLLIIPTLGIITLLGLFSGYKNQELILLELFAISMILDSYATVFSSIRRILGNFKLISFFRIVRSFVNLIIIFFALSISSTALYLAGANTMLSLVVFLISLVNSVLLVKPKINLAIIKEFFKDSLIFSLNDFFLNIYARISTVLLSVYASMHMVGIFSAALKFTKIANLLPNQLRFALLPTMYRILDEGNNAKKNQRVFILLIKYLSVLSTLLVVIIILFSDQIINLIFGTKYNSSIPLVKLLSLFIYFRFIQTPFSLFFIAMNKHKQMVLFQGATSILNLTFALILIPQFYDYGACVSSILSEGFFTSLLILTGRKYNIWDLKKTFVLLAKPIVAVSIGFTILNLFLSHSNIFLQLSVLTILYFITLIVFKTFDSSDKDLIKKILLTKNL